MKGAVWVFAEQRRRELHEVSLELLGEGRKLAEKLDTRLSAVLLGHGVAGMAQELIDHGADRVYLADAPILRIYQAEPYAHVVERLVRQHAPQILLLGATSTGSDLAPRVAARLGTGLSADCTALEIDAQGLLVQIVPAFGGKVMARIICPDRRPQMATVRPGVMRQALRTDGKGQIIPVEVEIAPDTLKARVVEVTPLEEEEVGATLTQAAVVVAGGYGVGSREIWTLVEDLAQALKGAVGATRPAVDEGWVPEGQMIGQSGRVVRPRLYIGVGISGAMQHMVGVRESKIIVAINSDPKAPIFAESDLNILGDLREMLPALIKEIRSERLGV